MTEARRIWAVAASIAVAITLSASPAWATAPATSIVVTPSSGLHDGQTVKVVFKGVAGTYTVSDTVAQCVSKDAADYQNDPSKDCQNLTYTPVGVVPGVGSGQTTLTVKATDLKGNPCNDTNNICTINVRPDFQTYVGSLDTPIGFTAAASATSHGTARHPGGSSATSWAVVAAAIVVVGALGVIVRRRRPRVAVTPERSPA